MKTRLRFKTGVLLLLVITWIFLVSFSIHWGWVTTLFGFICVALIIILVAGFLADKLKDEQLLQVTDLRILEEAKEKRYTPDLSKLYEKETGRVVPKSLDLITPDARAYVNWLEECSRNFIIIRNGLSKSDIPDFEYLTDLSDSKSWGKQPNMEDI
jgi:hypothetical protein